MPDRSKLLRTAAWCSLLLSLTACAGRSGTTPSVVPPPTIPSMPPVEEPPPSGSYWTKHCELVAKVRRLLNSTPPTSAFCPGPGPETR